MGKVKASATGPPKTLSFAAPESDSPPPTARRAWPAMRGPKPRFTVPPESAASPETEMNGLTSPLVPTESVPPVTCSAAAASALETKHVPEAMTTVSPGPGMLPAGDHLVVSVQRPVPLQVRVAAGSSRRRTGRMSTGAATESDSGLSKAWPKGTLPSQQTKAWPASGTTETAGRSPNDQNTASPASVSPLTHRAPSAGLRTTVRGCGAPQSQVTERSSAPTVNATCVPAPESTSVVALETT